MFASLLLTIGLAGLGAAIPAENVKRAPAQVYSKCTVPNTVALTFVRIQMVSYLSAKQFIVRMTAHTFTCRLMLHLIRIPTH